MHSSFESSKGDVVMPIAIIGMSFRGPGDAVDLDSFYRMIYDAREAWGPVPLSKWNNDAFYHPDANHNGTSNIGAGHYFSADLSRFDAPFFNMTHDEAKALDPQQRLLLECSYECLESAGVSLKAVGGSNTSVFVGSFTNDYTDMLLRDPETVPLYQATGSGHSRAILSNRLSYFYDFHGPSVTIDTACSASLVALHMACQSLRTGESEQAIVAGVNVILSHEMSISMSRMRFFSPDGRCHTFDDRANGYGRGEGVGCVLLKPLSVALRDADPIRGIIRSTGINQDGKTAGITLPNPSAQEALLRHVYNAAALDPISTDYVECHGTGTRAGDYAELSAIANVFCTKRTPENPLVVASVKTNVGHLEGASGIAGLIKVILMMEKKTILPHRNFEIPNKQIPFEKWNLKVPTRPQHWDARGPRRASINSFGYGGTNAHAIVEEAGEYLAFLGREIGIEQDIEKPQTNGVPIPESSSHSSMSSLVYALSSADPVSGTSYANRLSSYIEGLEHLPKRFPSDLAYTVGKRSSNLRWKAAVAAQSVRDLTSLLKSSAVQFSQSMIKDPVVGFVFTGQGVQWHAMGRELMCAYPVYREIITRAGECLRWLGATWDLTAELSKSAELSQLNKALLSQPICTAVQIGLVELLGSWNISPTSVCGHSSGEIAAAYAVGALSLEDAMKVAYFRGVVSEKLSYNSDGKGGMMVVGLSEQGVLPFIERLKEGKVTVACVNSPSSITVAGDGAGIEELQRYLAGQEIFARRLNVSVAYHSQQMAQVASEYCNMIANITIQPVKSRVQFFSTVYGDLVDSSELGPDYWVSNLLGQVKFAKALKSLCLGTLAPGKPHGRRSKSAVNILVEVGPHSALSGPIKDILRDEQKLHRSEIIYSPSLVRNTDAVVSCHQLTCKLITAGCQVDLVKLNRIDPKNSKILMDLPSYAWNHSRSYWAEPRLSKSWRTSSHPRHDLLGSMCRDSNPLQPQWRCILRTSELPWIKDHRILSEAVFPAAGFLAMAVEAMREHAKTQSIEPVGFYLREFTISHALIFPSALEESEVMISLKPYSDSIRAPSNKWYEFSVVSVNEQNRWTEHCRGLVGFRKDGLVENDVNGDFRARAEEESLDSLLCDFKVSCNARVDPRKLYERLQLLGLDYGETFTNIKDISVMPNKSRCFVTIPNTRAIMPYEYESSFLVHPATLDSIIQTLFPAIESGLGTLRSPALPVFVREVYIDNDFPRYTGQDLEVLTTVVANNAREHTASMTVVGGQMSSKKVALSICDLKCADINPTDVQGGDSPAVLQPVYKVNWREDVDLLTPDNISDICSGVWDQSQEEGILARERAAFYYMEQVLLEIRPEEVAQFRDYHQQFWDCMNMRVQEIRRKKGGVKAESWVNATSDSRARFLEEIKSHGDEGRLLCHVGQNLARILRQQVEPLQFMFEDGYMDDYYATNIQLNMSHEAAARYMELLAHKNPSMSILEIGAGTGGSTLHLLQALDRVTNNRAHLSRYCFTDISKAFFQSAREKFHKWESMLEFRVLDIEKDPTEQGYMAHKYDVVIADNVLHATKKIQDTLQNVRKLLKPGGKLILVELVRESLSSITIFGTLPGWWAGRENGRPHGPSMFSTQWHSLLKQTGFSGLDADVRGPEAESMQLSSMMASTAVVNPAKLSTTADVVVTANLTCREISLHCLKDRLVPLVKSVSSATLTTVEPQGKVCIILDDFTNSYFSNPTREQFEGIRRISTAAAGILWVVRGGNISVPNPDANFITGFARTIRSENPDKLVGVLDLSDAQFACPYASANQVIKVFEALFTEKSVKTGASDVEFAECDGRIFIPRLVEDSQAKERISYTLSRTACEYREFCNSRRPLKIEVSTPGLLDSIRFVDDHRLQAQLAPDCVEIQVQASGLNFKDVMIAVGQIDYEPLGLEYSGTVTSIGEQVQNILPGDRVCGYSCGTIASVIREKAAAVQKIPDSMSFETAASLPIIFCTAYFAVHRAAAVKSGDKVLIHAASGGLGQALIQLCQMSGAEIYATVGNKVKKDFLISTFNIDKDHILFSRDTSFAKDIKRLTHGIGVDVIMNSLASDMLRLTWECIAPFGRFVELGARDYTVNSRLEMAQFQHNVSFTVVNLASLIREKPWEAAAVWASVMNLAREKQIKPPSPLTTFGASEVEKALRTMQTGKHMGKLVIVPSPKEVVKALPLSESTLLFRTDASYVLVGAFGNLGRLLAFWMVDHGVRHLILFSRSGKKSSEAQATVESLEKRGVTVTAPACDISDASQLSECLGTASSLPPIRGMIHAAAVWHDAHLEHLEYDDFNSIVWPKVRGTWNLHNYLPKDMDFFFLVSSSVGVTGVASQAAYAGASTFLASFAAYRRGLGLPAVSVDFGIILGTTLGNNAELVSNTGRQGVRALSEEEFLATVSSAVPDGGYDICHIITGLKAWEESLSLVYREPRFSHMQSSSDQSTAWGDSEEAPSLDRLRVKLRQVKTMDDAIEMISEGIISKLSALSMVPINDIQLSQTLSSYGIDSLVAVELRNWIFSELDTTVSVLEILANDAISSFAEKVASKSKLLNV
ncbi:hypothetical protein BDV23DRAFT_187535 [Aspergillus alliaceus]|uniref:Polyketide synthase n=1 Tax=Petromyces alliaceus TaxID=209559 RepID=A0A5N7BWE3_PETAA|nr:hypothetical protein BDV23DRAFT_187535 [Aspergillus alliaceus]